MQKIYLIKEYHDSDPGEVISVTNNVAFGLIEGGIARKVESRDFLVKPEFGQSKALDTGKGMFKAPKKKYKKIKY